jgi:hypothetical protein
MNPTKNTLIISASAFRIYRLADELRLALGVFAPPFAKLYIARCVPKPAAIKLLR